MAIDVSVVGRRPARLLQAACAAAAIALLAAPGCDRASDLSEDHEVPAGTMTEDEFVDHVAALTVAVEQGLVGDEARDRAAELAGSRYARDEIEAFADILRADPVRWAAVADRIDRRVADLRSAGSGGPADAGAGEPPGGGGPADAGTDEPRGGGTPDAGTDEPRGGGTPDAGTDEPRGGAGADS